MEQESEGGSRTVDAVVIEAAAQKSKKADAERLPFVIRKD